MIASTIKCCTCALRKHLFHRCLAAAFDFSQNLPLRMHQLLLSQYPGIYFLLLKQSYFEAFLERRCLVISSAFLEWSKLPLAPILSSASQIHLWTFHQAVVLITALAVSYRLAVFTADGCWWQQIHVFFAACRAATCCSRSHCSYDTAIQYSSCWPWCAISKCSSWCCKSLIQPSFAVSLFSAAPILRVRLCYAFRTFSQLINFASASAAPFKSLYQWYVPNISAFM